MQRRELEDHDKICDHKLVECDEHCGVTLIRRDLPNHKRNECPEVRLTCPNGCIEKRLLGPDVTSRIKRKDLHNHVTNTCKMRVVGCPFKDQGCSLQFAFQDLENHLQHNMSSHILILLAQNTQIQKKNVTLSEKVESLNSSLEAKTVLLDERRAHFQVKQEEVLMLKRQLDELSEKCSSLERQCSFLTLKNTELEEELSKAKEVLSTYTWVIHEYHILTRKHPTGSCFKSPSFRLCGYKWYLILYPNGDDKKHEEFLSLHLCIADSNLPEVLRSGRVPTGEVPVKYGLRIMSRLPGNDVSYKVTMVFEKSATVSKHHEFMKTRETLSENYCDYLNNNRLVVKCTIHPAM
ncbi:TNF receptor-associated factor family protein DDB_G0290931-like [Actinia tenebrosa]|uniref:TNF receptor-associated factor family protein DDB_G0290931-like n=1 Tax=Actinia tenebrosa TaxID=6105 RepID=A0A6P8H2B1_ACTTE|nr:TNF receptor-associated factor family protein DDB_G0290931-like [Actinia tenebrosa]